jgi:type II secretory pathway pseudopilin PulG
MKEKGITLVEIIIAILITALFSAILISDFPRILKQFALSKASYRLAQDFRKVQDLGLSGVQILDSENNPINAKGYGVYISLDDENKYIIYADRGGESFNSIYDNNLQSCSDISDSGDCILETINITNENPDLYIEEIKNSVGNFTSINFAPPGPIVELDNLSEFSSEIGIVLGLRSYEDLKKTIWVNTAGLIRIE